MNSPAKPAIRPARPFFSSGPTAKYLNWSPGLLEQTALSRSHRSKVGKTRLKKAIAETRELLQLPKNYRAAIVPASDTGAFEMAMWSLLGPRGVDVFAWDSFGSDWANDAKNQLKIPDLRILQAEYGKLPDLAQADPKRDAVFVWNGTTSGVRVPHAEWIADNRQGLTLCDATSAVFAQKLPWNKLDVVTFSWQKSLGGEAAHGILILGPRAVERLETHTPNRPIPKIFRLTSGGKLNEALFEGATINTPSMLCVEDYLAALNWVRSIGGEAAMIRRANANLQLIAQWAAKTSWIDFLCASPEARSNTSVCLKITDPAFTRLEEKDRKAFVKSMAALLEDEEAGFDLDSYRAAPPGLRLWAGGTVEAADLIALFPWLDWAYAACLNRFSPKA